MLKVYRGNCFGFSQYLIVVDKWFLLNFTFYFLASFPQTGSTFTLGINSELNELEEQLFYNIINKEKLAARLSIKNTYSQIENYIQIDDSRVFLSENGNSQNGIPFNSLFKL